jgi:hypothetical protein
LGTVFPQQAIGPGKPVVRSVECTPTGHLGPRRLFSPAAVIHAKHGDDRASAMFAARTMQEHRLIRCIRDDSCSLFDLGQLGLDRFVLIVKLFSRFTRGYYDSNELDAAGRQHFLFDSVFLGTGRAKCEHGFDAV